METQEKPSEETLRQLDGDPVNWRLGVFYYKKDKRIFASKRIDFIGWTLNFTNPYSIIVMGAIILIIAFVESSIPNKFYQF